MCYIIFRKKEKKNQQLKTTKPGSHKEAAELAAFNANTKLCPVIHPKENIVKTKVPRKGSQLSIGYVKPHVPVGRQTFSRWVKSVNPRGKWQCRDKAGCVSANDTESCGLGK